MNATDQRKLGDYIRALMAVPVPQVDDESLRAQLEYSTSCFEMALACMGSEVGLS